MILNPGAKLGPYEIVSGIGAGGMGEVYKARDTRLNRFVAIKVLPEHVSNNPELKARFQREAQTLASLSHPHICSVFDVGEQDGGDYLVMEFLEGQTLAQRLEKGVLPLDEALKTAIEIADALDKAHKQAVIHRDIKPSNVMLTKNGIKLFDFGLAKLRPSNQPVTLTALPTNPDITVQGAILGTLQYMSPEQLEGKDAEAQTDVFALGVVLYEMVTGKKAFTGKSQMSLAAAILEHEPPPIRTIQPLSPSALDHVVQRCLAKRPEERWQNAGDVMRELKWVAENLSLPVQTIPTTRTRNRIHAIVTMLLLALMALLGFVLVGSRPHVNSKNARFLILPPDKNNFGTATTILAASPDGTRLVFLASGSDGMPRLWVRPLDSLTAQPLSGTEGTSFGPFWSADSRSIGFFAGGKLKKIDANGGPPQTLCDASVAPLGGTWNRDGVILFNSQSGKGLYRVSAAGGQPTEFTKLDASRKEITHEWPHFLPDGRHFLYLATSSETQNWGVYVASLDSADRKPLLNSESEAQYSEPGYLLFVRDRTLMAQQFDARKLEVKGDAFPITEGTGYLPNGSVSFSVSPSGVLADRPASIGLLSRLAWFNREGKEISSIEAPAGQYADPELSPDEKRLAVARNDIQFRTSDIWLIDLVRNVPSRFTFERANEFSPIWSPDGNQLAFVSSRTQPGIYQKRTSGGGNDELLMQMSSTQMSVPNFETRDWSRDGRLILYSTGERARNLWALPLTGDRKPFAVTHSEFRQNHAKFSPNGRWIAYESNESGRPEIYVQPFPQGEGKWQISNNSGLEPRWRADGKELFFLDSEGKVMSAAVKTDGAAFEAGSAKLLFQLNGPLLLPGARTRYTVSSDGRRFLFNLPPPQVIDTPITVILDWTATLRK